MTDLTDTLADQPLASEGLTFEFDLVVAESVSASDSLSFVLVPGGVLNETAKATDSASLSNVAFALTLAGGSAKATGVFKVAQTISLTNTATASDAWAVAVTPSINDKATARSTVSASLSRQLGVIESVKARDAWAYADLRTASDTAQASDAVSYAYRAGVQVTDSALATSGLSSVRRASAALVERVRATDAPTDNYVYNVSMLEVAYASVPYLEPSGSVSAWAINTRTNAVTQYTNFDFTSFAPMGRKYLAAGPDGLYELNGARDDNMDVLANMMGAFFQANGMKMAGLKGVYLSVGGQGRGAATGTWLLKIKLGDGREYVYQKASNPGLMVTKFNMGKGLHANYMGWELANQDGQDFDFDKIEFVPMMSGRRVG